MNNSTNGKRTDSEVDANKMTGFLQRNVKYISAGILVVALAVVIAITATGNNKGSDDKPEGEVTADLADEPSDDTANGDTADNESAVEHEYEVDLPEVKTLISTYYNSYAAGDVDNLDTIAQSLSNMEKSYIKMMNEYVEGYNNITCYTKAGLEEGSYMASVAYDMKFHNVERELPGMDFFYIRTNEEGKLYIDNLYSYFNRETREQSLNENIEASIKDFENGNDVKQLLQESDEKYNQAVAEDNDLKEMVETVRKAVEDWVNTYTPEEENAEGGQADDSENNGADTNTDEENNDDTSDENTDTTETNNTDNSNSGTSTGINYVPEGTVMTASSRYNVRSSMDETSELLGTTDEGDTIKVILSYAEGWTKVEWSNKTGYIRTDLLLNN